MSAERMFGLTPFHLNLCRLAIGCGQPQTYVELGLQNNALLPKPVPEALFRPRFIDAVRRGLLCWSTEREGLKGFKYRRYEVTDRGWLAVVDVTIAEGGDYHYYKNFDGTGSSLDKFETKGKDVRIQFKGRKEAEV